MKEKPIKPIKPIICLDFDGVLHSYVSGWLGATNIPDPPVTGAFEALNTYMRKFDVCVVSTRSFQPGGREAMREWLVEQYVRHYEETWPKDEEDIEVAARKWVDQIEFPLVKPPAMVTIDDRAWRFDGKWPSVDDLYKAKPWWKD